MKTLCRDNISYHMFADNKSVTINSVNVVVGDPVEYYIGDLNSSNCVLHTGVTEPSGYVAGGKHMFDGTTWSINPKWVDPPAKQSE